MSEPRVIVVAHGRSEVELVLWMMSRLHMSIVIDSKNNGREAIRIENLSDWFSQKHYTNERELHRRFVELEYFPKTNNPMPRLVIFVMMDTENDLSSRAFITGDVFKSHPLKDRIVPIYCHPNMDTIFGRLGKGDISANKINSYRNILDELEPRELYELLKCDKDTNMGVFIRYCLDTRPNNQGRYRL